MLSSVYGEDLCNNCAEQCTCPLGFILYRHWIYFLLTSSISLSFCSKYWPLFLLFFYILSPIPYCISRRVVDDTDSASNACKELAIFLTTGIVISAFGLPIVFARAEVVSHSSLLICFVRMESSSTYLRVLSPQNIQKTILTSCGMINRKKTILYCTLAMTLKTPTFPKIISIKWSLINLLNTC